MAINQKRKEKMIKKSNEELLKIMKSGSLSSSAALYELNRRRKNG